MSEKKIFLLSITIFLLLLAATALPVYIVLNHKSSFNGLLSSVPEREYNAIIAKTQEYNAAILGSSMSECFKCSELDKVMKCNSLKLTINGCNFAEARFMADYAAKYKKLDIVMMGVFVLAIFTLIMYQGVSMLENYLRKKQNRLHLQSVL